MARYIDADAVNRVFIDELGKIQSVFIDERIEWVAAREAIIRCARGIAAIPTADVPDRKIGKWEEKIVQDENPWFRRRFYCSVCGDWNTYGKSDFCPNCGAEMKGEKDE